MAIAAEINVKTIDELLELGKLTGTEKTIVSYNGKETRKVSIDTIVGYMANLINSSNTNSVSLMSLPMANSYGGSIIVVPEGTEIPIEQRTPGCFYLEQTKQTSIRTKVNVPTSVVVSSSLSLKRV